MRSEPKKAVPKTIEVEYMIFEGWGNAQDIFEWSHGMFFFVPRGYEHSLRFENEYDRSTGHVLENAPEFLIYVRSDRTERRVDLLTYIVLVDSEFKFHTRNGFVLAYNVVES